MLRITPIYGSRFDLDGAAQSPSCTMVEYGGVKILWNVGWWGEAAAAAATATTTTTTVGTVGTVVDGSGSTTTTDQLHHHHHQQQHVPKLSSSTTAASTSSSGTVQFPELPDHDVLIVSDSTLNSLGGLPLYYRHYWKRKQKMYQQQQQQQHEQQQHEQQQEDHTNVRGDATTKTTTSSSLAAAAAAPPPPKMLATFPTVKMGQMTLYDYHACVALDGGTPPFTLSEMDQVFSHLQTIKYSQSVHVQPTTTTVTTTTVTEQSVSSSSLTITAHRAGHVVGGAFFVLRRLQDDTVVVLVPPTYNIAKEMHLDPSTILKDGATPDVLVTYPGGPAMQYLCKLWDTSLQPISLATTTATATATATARTRTTQQQQQLLVKKKRNLMKSFAVRGGTIKQLTEQILSVLRRDGHVLLPVDASGRVLELLLILSHHWDKQRLGAAYNLVWLGPMVQNTLDFCRSQLEWMANSLGTQFDDGGIIGGGGRGGGGGKTSSNNSSSTLHHPYALRNVHLCSTVQELDAVIRQNNNNPTCVLASGLSLDHGPARDLFLRWAENADHAIIFTDSSRCFQRRSSSQQQQQQQQHGSDNAMDIVVDDDDDKDEQYKKEMEASKTVFQRQQSSSSSSLVVTDTTAAAAATVGTDVDTGAEPDEDDDNDNTMMVGRALGVDEKASKFCASAQLLQHWAHAKWEEREMDDSIDVDVQVPHRLPLAGPELKAFLAREEAKRLLQKQQEAKRAMLREVELAKGQLRLGEEEEVNKGGEAAAATTTTTTTTGGGGTTGDLLANGANSAVVQGRPKKKSRFDSSLFIKFSKPLHLTFEVREEVVGVGQSDTTAKYGIGESIGRVNEVLEDDYGIAVKPERFTDIVSGVDPSKFTGGTGRIGEDVVRRGFGYAGATGASKAGGGTNVDDDEVGELEDDMDEQAMEAEDLSEGTGIIRGRSGRPPTKVTTVPRRLEVLAEIAYIPLEGRVSAQAARQSVRALQPRQVVVLGGKAPIDRPPPSKELPLEVVDEVSILAEAAQVFITDRSSVVHAPSDGEVVELSIGHSAYSARLVDTPFETKREKQQREEVGRDPPDAIQLYETRVGSCTVSLLNTVATGQKVAVDGSIVLAPRAISKVAAMRRPSVYASDGEVLLTDLRSDLIAQGMKAEYSTHAGYAQLIVNGKVLVKKEKDSRQIDVEGPLCEDFFTVRGVIRGQYVTL